MTALFPDSGVPPSDAKNSLPDPNTVNCNELWYSTSRCQPRFDPAQANAVISELVNLINKGEVTYDCTFLDRVQLAVRYLIQRGLSTGVPLSGGPFNYGGAMQPTLTRYNDFLTIVAVPGLDNQGAVTLDLDAKGPVPVLRSDRQQLQFQDLKAGIPTLLCFFANTWWHVGLAASQVPIVVRGGIDVWVRTDGNDTTGDGTANTPDKAFRTVNGAWTAVGQRYAATPLFTMNFRLGIPGSYDCFSIGPFGGNVSVVGDTANRSAYRIKCQQILPSTWLAANITSMQLTLRGITLECGDGPVTAGSLALRSVDSNIGLDSVAFYITVSNPNCAVINCFSSIIYNLQSETWIDGNGYTISGVLNASTLSTIEAHMQPPFISSWLFRNITVNNAFLICSALSTIHFAAPINIIVTGGCVGTQYIVNENSIINMGSVVCPGTVAGAAGSGGIFIP